MNTVIQEQIPAWYFASYGKPLEKRQVDLANSWVRKAVRQTRRQAEREFIGRGFSIVYKELGVAGVHLRARLNIRAKELSIDPNAEVDLFQNLDTLGLPLSPTPKELIVTHELFHLFCHRCPTDIAELAAHLYCVELLQLDYFPGMVDFAARFAPLAVTA